MNFASLFQGRWAYLTGLIMFSLIVVVASTGGTAAAAPELMLPDAGESGLAFMGAGIIVSQAALEAMRRSFSTIFKQGFGSADHFWNMVAMEVLSTTGSNQYGWLGQWPAFREWVGDRVYHDMKEHGYTLANRKFESSVSVGRDQIEDDNLGIYKPMVEEMGRASGVFPDELVANIINAGDVNLCYDGQPMFDTEHPVYANSDGTGAATLVSNVAGAGANPAWYLLDTSRAVKPFIYQVRRKPEFAMMTSLTDEAVFTSDSFRMGVSIRAEAGYGLWQMAYKSTLPLNAANFEAARNAMHAIKADGGRPMGCKPTVLLCGTVLEADAERVLVREKIDGGDTNVNRGKAKIISTEWLDA